VIGMVVAAVMIPLLAVGWALVSGAHGATPKATVAKTVSDQAIVNINGMIPNGYIAGTGMVLTSTGLVLTNNHVVANTSADLPGGRCRCRSDRGRCGHPARRRNRAPGHTVRSVRLARSRRSGHRAR
jgi:hypothetical protein